MRATHVPRTASPLSSRVHREESLHLAQVAQRLNDRASPREHVHLDIVFGSGGGDERVGLAVIVAWHPREQVVGRVQVETPMEPIDPPRASNVRTRPELSAHPCARRFRLILLDEWACVVRD